MPKYELRTYFRQHVRNGLPGGSSGGLTDRLDGEACRHELLAKFSEEGFCINELTPRSLIEGLFESSLLFGG